MVTDYFLFLSFRVGKMEKKNFQLGKIFFQVEQFFFQPGKIFFPIFSMCNTSNGQ